MKESESEFEAWRSNDAFTEDTQNRIRDLLSLAHREVESLNLEIFMTRSVGQLPSNELSTLLTRKMEEMENLRGAISPLKKIPRELLCEFFLYCDDLGTPVTIPSRQSRTFPWTLAQVCSHWRNILWGTPGVWENVKICDDVLESEIPAVTSVFREIIRRSAAQISLIVPHNDELFTSLVIPCLDRLKALEIIVGEDSFRTLFELPAGPVDSLASINLHFIGDDLPPLETNPFQTAHGLRKVTLTMTLTTNGSIRECPDYLWLLPWSQLTEIAFPNSIIPIHTIHAILGQCVCLRTGTLVVGRDTPSGSLDKEIVVPKLESLVLYRAGPCPDWDTFLHPLMLPSLRLLMVPDAQTWNQAAFTPLVIRSTCPLKSLHLAYYRNTTHDLYSLVKQLPSLNRLVLPWLHIPSSVFKAIHRREILPTLEHMECLVDSPGLNVLLDLVEQHVSGKSGANASTLGIRTGAFICADEDEAEVDDVIRRYHSLRPKFQDNGRDIRVFIAV